MTRYTRPPQGVDTGLISNGQDVSIAWGIPQHHKLLRCRAAVRHSVPFQRRRRAKCKILSAGRKRPRCTQCPSHISFRMLQVWVAHHSPRPTSVVILLHSTLKACFRLLARWTWTLARLFHRHPNPTTVRTTVEWHSDTLRRTNSNTITSSRRISEHR